MNAAAAAAATARPLDAHALGKLRWRCRRGLLENDLLLERFFARAAPVSEDDARGLALLMELADNELLDLFLGRRPSSTALQCAASSTPCARRAETRRRLSQATSRTPP